MRKFLIALGAALALAAGSSMANQCPADMKKIDEALAKNPQLSAADMESVKKARADGEKLHKDGKHKESMEALDKAKKMLKVQ